MTPNDREQFGLLLVAMVAAYPTPKSEPPDHAMLEGYWMVLEDFDLEMIRWAVACLMKTEKWILKAAEIRALIVERLTKEAAELRSRVLECRSYVEAIAGNLIRDQRRQGKSYEEIKAALAAKSEEIGWPLYWPGEEPWATEPLARAHLEGPKKVGELFTPYKD